MRLSGDDMETYLAALAALAAAAAAALAAEVSLRTSPRRSSSRCMAAEMFDCSRRRWSGSYKQSNKAIMFVYTYGKHTLFPPITTTQT